MLRKAGAAGTLLLLLTPLLMACAQLLHGQMLVWGDDLYPGYARIRSTYSAELRAAAAAQDEAAAPAVREEESLNSLLGGDDSGDAPATAPGSASKARAGDDALDDLLDDTAPDTPAGKAAGSADPAGKGETGGDALDDLLDETADPADAEKAAKPAEKLAGDDAKKPSGDALDDLLDETAEPASDEAKAAGSVTAATAPSGGEAGGDGGDDLLDGLDTPDPIVPPAAKTAAETAAAAAAAAAAAKPIVLTAGQRAYCRVERGIASLGQLGVTWMPVTMVLLLLFAAFITTFRRHHISLRSASSALEDRVSNIAQIFGNLMVAASAYSMLGIPESDHRLHTLWLGGMLAMCAVNLLHVARPVQNQPGTKLTVGRVLATIPLYTWMAVISGLYFFFIEDHPTGLAIYLAKLSEFSILYVQVGLYLWSGMLLRDTTLGQLLFDIIRPLKPPPEVFAVLVVVFAALPTAYSGASGILVLALGGTIYTELRRAGAGQQRALAATAMSGSLGVVLPPCLLVVIVASLNLDVTTDELFHWGWRVFGLTTLIFVAVSWFFRKHPWTFSPEAGASGEVGKAVSRLLPYVGIAGVVVLFFAFVFNAGLDEHTAPYVLPVAMMAIMPWDKLRIRKAKKSGVGPADDAGSTRETMLDTGTHIGALLILMGLSACLGGVIERSEIIELFPHHLGSPYAAMAVLMVVLILIGMIMDPYGAVILVSVTLYPIAKENGIHPLNFWMTALVSFELGYLTPPVALNHLLTRQVVQSLPEFDEDEFVDPALPFWRRHERIVLPIVVLATTLLIVAFGPIAMGAGDVLPK